MAEKKETPANIKRVERNRKDGNAPLELCNLLALGHSMKDAKKILAKRKA